MKDDWDKARDASARARQRNDRRLAPSRSRSAAISELVRRHRKEFDELVKAEHGECDACGHAPACGFASVYENDVQRWYCHTDDHSCYRAAVTDLSFRKGMKAVAEAERKAHR